SVSFAVPTGPASRMLPAVRVLPARLPLLLAPDRPLASLTRRGRCVKAKRPGEMPGRRPQENAGTTRSVAPRAQQLQQHHEQVDEVEIEAQRPHHRLLAGHLVAVAREIHLLDL